MDHDPDEYAEIVESAGLDSESLTIVLVAGGSRDEVLRLLGAEAAAGADTFADSETHSAYAATDVRGGVVALEHSGYADPSPRVLAALSSLGGTAAVSRSNIQGNVRFGCARDGDLVFDSNEFMYVEEDERDDVPSELRPLFDSVWDDLESDDVPEDTTGDVGLAMAALWTGVSPTTDDLRRAVGQGYHRTPSMTYFT